ncbi:hypothetical protein [Poseidonibacter lekithochrous]|uniref:hypothetical protein n=1 Tax=Poseidonibacter lekithochrous TaxID=1904463 RepID=UPI0008FC382F|nr:hypothetical protein [Poseidonibacter lekithochrous]QKJ21654.1 hypothetical protein ALEK_0351 [Poseidonibacter lekithochrous]
MLDFFKRRLKNQTGATESVLVTLFLVIVGVGALIAISSWFNTEEEGMRTSATQKMSNVKTELK